MVVWQHTHTHSQLSNDSTERRNDGGKKDGGNNGALAPTSNPNRIVPIEVMSYVTLLPTVTYASVLMSSHSHKVNRSS